MASPSGDSSSTPLLDRYQNVLMLLLIVAIGAGVAAFVLSQPPPTSITIIPPPPTGTLAPTQTPAPTPTPGPIQVYVTGEVMGAPQLVTVPYASRVVDVIEIAGGFTPDADQVRLNMAQVLRDGDQVHVFPRESVLPPEQASVALATPVDNGIVYLNSATAEELETLPRIGPAMAERILSHIEANGPFMALEDLVEVDGIGPATVESIAPFVSLEIR